MKKEVGGCLSALLLSMMVGALGCWSPAQEELPPQNATAKTAAKMPPKVTIKQETVSAAPAKKVYDAPASPGVPDDANDGDDLCQQDSDCIVVPTNGCLPCMDNSGQVPVNKAAARRIMAPKKDQCMPLMDQLKQGQQPTRSQDASCQYNGAKCQQGVCVLATLSEDELKAQMQQSGVGGAGNNMAVGPSGNYPAPNGGGFQPNAGMYSGGRSAGGFPGGGGASVPNGYSSVGNLRPGNAYQSLDQSFGQFGQSGFDMSSLSNQGIGRSPFGNPGAPQGFSGFDRAPEQPAYARPPMPGYGQGGGFDGPRHGRQGK